MFSSYTPIAVYPADGVQTDFAAPDKFYDAADVRAVLVVGGDEIPVQQGVDFSVVVIGRETTPPFRQTGLLRFVVPPEAGVDVVPFILPNLIQDQAFEGRPVQPREHERVHDRHVQTLAILFEFFNRGYRSPLNTPAALRFIAAGRQGYVPTWDAEGNLIEGPTVGQVAIVAEFIDEVNIVAGIRDQVVAAADMETEIRGLYPIRTEIAGLYPARDAIPTLAPYVDEITELAPVAAQIGVLGPMSDELLAVYAIRSQIVTVDSNIVAINEVADNMAAILAAPDHAQTATDKAGEAAESAADALASENAVALAAVPVGRIVMRFGAVDPGYIAWGEGGTFDRATYPDLAAWLDVNGASLGLDAGQIAAGTIPDWRDYSPRTAGGALGPSVGDTQEDALQGHKHTGSSSIPAQTGATFGIPGGTNQKVISLSDLMNGYVSDGINGTPRVAEETRVKSFGVRWQIKAYGAVVNQGTADLVAIEQAVQEVRNGALRKDVDQSAGYGVPEKVTILKNTLQAWEVVPGGIVDVTDAVASVSWSSLGMYRRLRLSGCFVPVSNGAALNFRVGAGSVDAGANYSYENLGGFSSTVAAGASTAQTAAVVATATGTAAGRLAAFDVFFAEFNRAQIMRSFSSFGNSNNSGTHTVSVLTSTHDIAAARDVLSLLASTGNIGAGSHFVLEGLRG